MTKKRFIIYALVDPRDGSVRYIGKSSSGLYRARAHSSVCVLSKDRNTRKRVWIESLQAEGLSYQSHVLEEVPSQQELDAREVFWIAEAKRLGADLFNMTEGGEGTYGYVPTAEARARASAAKKGIPLSSEHRAAIARAMNEPAMKLKLSIGHKTSPLEKASRSRIAEARRGSKASVETRAKMSAAHKGRIFSAEHIANLVKARARQPPCSVETRAKISAARTGNTASESARAKMSAARKGKPLAPAHREKIAAANRRRAAEYQTTKTTGVGK